MSLAGAMSPTRSIATLLKVDQSMAYLRMEPVVPILWAQFLTNVT